MKTVQSIVILGAGLVGSLLAILLSRRGYSVSIYEKRKDSRKQLQAAGRSINMAVSRRAWDALERAGIADEVRQWALPMQGRQIHYLDGSEGYMPYGTDNEAIYSVSRRKLNEVLLNVLEEENKVTVRFETPCVEVDFLRSSLAVQPSDGCPVRVEADLMIGADGVNSTLRDYFPSLPDFYMNRHRIAQAYKELTIPADRLGKHQLRPDRLHIWPRGKFMLIALPNTDGSFTCTLFLPLTGELSFEGLNTDMAVALFFGQYFPDVVPLLPTLKEQFRDNPVSSLMSVACYPWCYEEKALLIGDAAHAILPFYGQGMNAGFEDCSVLTDQVDYYDGDWSRILPSYQQQRKRDSDAIAALSLQNYEEMQGKTADPLFLLRKKIDAKLANEYPNQWKSLYGLVAFSNVPYHQVLQVGEHQNQILDRIMELDQIAQDWERLDYSDLLTTHREMAYAA